VIGIKCAGRKNFNMNNFKNLAISGLLRADLDEPLVAVHPPPKGSSGLVFAAG
jgi:hypothetical protein